MQNDLDGFYFDPEILPTSDNPTLKLIGPSGTPLLFPGDKYGDLANSFSGGTFSSSLDEIQSSLLGSAHLTRPRSLPDIAPHNATEAVELSEIPPARIESVQVSQFWKLYNAYPMYLKNVKKRARRKNRKGKAGSAPS
jgi:hypothetical protein